MMIASDQAHRHRQDIFDIFDIYLYIFDIFDKFVLDLGRPEVPE